MIEIETLAIAAAVFGLAGIVKGLVGFGLPTISLGLTTAATGLEQAIVLILWPTIVTNIWQALAGPSLGVLLRRLWPFYLASVSMVWAGVLTLTKLPSGWPEVLLGSLMLTYAVPLLAGFQVRISRDRETPLGVISGFCNGLFSGLTGSFTFPGVMYLQSIGLPRDALVQAMGLLFLLASVALWVALGSVSLATPSGTMASLLMVAPALAGVWGGLKVRRRLSEQTFRTVVLLSILVLGLYLIPFGILRMFE